MTTKYDDANKRSKEVKEALLPSLRRSFSESSLSKEREREKINKVFKRRRTDLLCFVFCSGLRFALRHLTRSIIEEEEEDKRWQRRQIRTSKASSITMTILTTQKKKKKKKKNEREYYR